MGDERTLDRRSILRTTAGAGIVAAGVGTVTGTVDGGGPADDAPRKLLVRDVDFFARGVVGQYVLVTDPAGEAPAPGTLPDCPFVDWPAGTTRRYQGLLLDRLTDDPHATRVPVYANARAGDVTVGTPFVIEAVEACGSFLGLSVEAIEVTDAAGTARTETDDSRNRTGGGTGG